MKKKLRLMGMLTGMACIASSAQAVHLNPNGMGEVLLYPYYTVENGQDTYFSIVNTTNHVKAVKVRLRESMNAAEVLGFNLYLAPFDHWAGAITRDPAGAGGMVITWDTSCTVPRITSTGTKLGTFSADGGPQGLERTREGFIEVIEMGIVDDQAPGAFGAEAAATHTTSGVPVDCGLLRAAWQDEPLGSFQVVGEWSNPTRNMIFDPDLAGGLYGYGVLINVPEGTNATYDAVALESFAGEILHGLAGPVLNDALPHSKILNKNTFIELEFDSAQSGLDAVSSVLMNDPIENDFVLEPGIAAGTDWVVTLPTKRDYVNSSAPIAPFLSTWVTPGVACENVRMIYWDREEQQPYTPRLPDDEPYFLGPSPVTILPSLGLCGAANVISFLGPDVNPDDATLEGYQSALYPSERSQVPFSVEFANGWVWLVMTEDFSSERNRRILEAKDGTELYGLPVIGFAVQKYSNTNLQGVSGSGAFYSGLINHKTTRHIIEP